MAGTPPKGSAPIPAPPHAGVPFGAPPQHHTNPWGVPFTPWPSPYQPPPEQERKLIPEWLKFAVSAVGAVLAVSGIIWKGGELVGDLRALKDTVTNSNAEQQRFNARTADSIEKIQSAVSGTVLDVKELNTKLERLNITKRNRRRDE